MAAARRSLSELAGRVSLQLKWQSTPQQEAQRREARGLRATPTSAASLVDLLGSRQPARQVVQAAHGMEEDGSGNGEPSLQLEGRSSFDRAW